MKRLLIILAACLPTTALSQDDVCRTYGDIAERIMAARQAEVPMSSMMAKAGADETGEAARELIRAITIAAYEEPGWAGDERQREATAEFRNDIELKCYQGKIQ